MLRKDIITIVRNFKQVSIPEIQKTYGIGYKEAKSIVDELVQKGDLVYSNGVVYRKKVTFESDGCAMNTDKLFCQKPIDRLIIDEPPAPPKPMSLSEYFKAKAAQYNSKPQKEEDESKKKEPPFNLNFNIADEEELRRKALQLCLESKNASVSFLQRTLPIGYIKACKLIDWMEAQGYISAPNGPNPRKILITQEEFDKKFRPHLFLLDDDDDDDDDDDEDPFEALERFQEEKRQEAFKKKLMDIEKKETQTASPAELIKKIKATTERLKNWCPSHFLWENEQEFLRTVRQKREEVVKSDKNIGVKGAIKKAEALLKETKDKGDEKLAEVYERLVYDFNNTTPYEYNKLKKKYFQ